ncbi:hypothetical protein [Streptomyces anandii]|uniref:hypothetical protein n=1 Tax=Streptomyces anandii TaxID=285454 RepID=UPI0037B525AE
MKAIAAERPPHNVMGTPAFAALATEGRTRRNELASLRQKLIAAAGQVQLEVRQAAREAGASPDAAKRAGALAEIEFLQWTGLFSGAIKRRRERLELYGW